METFLNILLSIVAIYLAVGLVFSVPFAFKGAGRIDASAKNGSWGFRLIIIPGVMALWPLLAKRWLAGGHPPEEKNAHRLAAKQSQSKEPHP